jgi:hypothetical protein
MSIEVLALLLGAPVAVGFRPFVAAAVFGAALRMGAITDPTLTDPSFQVFATDGALIMFGLLGILESVADKIPIVDHMADLAHAIAKPFMSALIAYVALGVIDPASVLAPLVIAAAVLGSASVTSAIHLTKAGIRYASTFAGGCATPLISMMEDTFVILTMVAVVFSPAVAIAVVCGATGLALYAAPRTYRAIATRFRAWRLKAATP